MYMKIPAMKGISNSPSESFVSKEKNVIKNESTRNIEIHTALIIVSLLFIVPYYVKIL